MSSAAAMEGDGANGRNGLNGQEDNAAEGGVVVAAGAAEQGMLFGAPEDLKRWMR